MRKETSTATTTGWYRTISRAITQTTTPMPTCNKPAANRAYRISLTCGTCSTPHHTRNESIEDTGRRKVTPLRNTEIAASLRRLPIARTRVNGLIALRESPNDAHHWRRASGVRYETESESRRPVHVPGWASFLCSKHGPKQNCTHGQVKSLGNPISDWPLRY